MTKYKVNDDGVAKAREMIDANQYDLHTEWGEAAPSTDDWNQFLDRHGWGGYSEWHLAIDTEASDETKDRYGFPYGDLRRVNRSALIHAKQRAAQNDHTEIVQIADELLQHLDSAKAG